MRHKLAVAKDHFNPAAVHGRHHPNRHCFSSARYYAIPQIAVCLFTEGEIYAYNSVDADAWLEFKADATRGHDWNLSQIVFRRANPGYTKLNAIPPSWTDTL